ncbi:DUF397 domain-containing protein [Nocardiopsis sp. N85]|uniref:DUF397 domain-containing protein n=1 Tax=Nocardiopsis sp. N85 TaxID=3029400 RepID=UPI00237FA602|nr:DUF397 domain-containing protein [Nocardiopsis sp. N85]MDE3721216.1 DUF397 domain-containing protein [Nocardiopsis sp. N85]
MQEEHGLIFRKSSHSTTTGECVEVAEVATGAAVRDSENPDKGHLTFPSSEWNAFLRKL